MAMQLYGICPVCGHFGYEHRLRIAQQINDHALNICSNVEKDAAGASQANMQRKTQQPPDEN